MRFKKRWITLIVIIGVIILAVYLVKRNSNSVSKETTLCIANNSVIYTQLGCHACENQEEIFRNNKNAKILKELRHGSLTGRNISELRQLKN